MNSSCNVTTVKMFQTIFTKIIVRSKWSDRPYGYRNSTLAGIRYPHVQGWIAGSLVLSWYALSWYSGKVHSGQYNIVK